MTRPSDGREHTNAPSSSEDDYRPEGPTARARERVGSTIVGRYRLDELLGVGGSAAVYAATELESGQRFAIKILHPELSARDDLVRRFLREGAIAKKLDHPGLVPIFEDGHTEDGAVFLVMEMLEGHTLERWATFEERLPIVESLRVAEEVLDLLAAAHDAGIVHRDIKPANLFRTRSGEIKVLDFGIARFFEGPNDGMQTQHGAGMGTPSFMPPEQARGRWNLVDGRTDVWAVGAVLFAVLSGEKPRIAETTHEELLLAMTQPVRSVLDAAPRLPPLVADVVDRALAFAMDDRFASARAMQAALRSAREILEDKSPASAPTRPDLLVIENAPESRSMVFVAPPPISDSDVDPVSLSAADLETRERPPLMVAPRPPAPHAKKPSTDRPPPLPAAARPREAAGVQAPPAPLPPAPGRPRGVDPATVPRSDVQSGGLSSLARSVVGFDAEHRYILVAAEGTNLIGLRLHRGIALWRHPIPDGPVWLAVFGRTVVVASGASLSTVDLVTGEVTLRSVLPRPVDPDDRVPNAPAIVWFQNPQPMLVARASGSTLLSIHAGHGTVVAERTFPSRVEMAAWHDVLLVLHGREGGKTLEILDPMTLATVAGPGRAPMPDAETVVSVTAEGPLLLVSGEKRGLFGSGSYVSVIDGRNMQEPVALRDKAIEPSVRPVLSGGGVIAVLRMPEGHALFAWPSGATAGTPLPQRKLVALAAMGQLVFTVLEDGTGSRELATIDATTLAPRFGYGPVVEAASLVAPAGLGAPPLAEHFVQRSESRVLVLAPTAPTHADVRCMALEVRAGTVISRL
ncbi:MAG: serine/threonine protein kinase [Myxococcales bacterium]|nr:serine/threonine protein kinase [Myxococcales bacterium]